KLLGSLKSGDEIVTSGGIFGTITNVKEDRFVVRVADNTKIEVGKAFVQTVLKSEPEEKK
ncbi:MAG: preprotein translocase subunit YajC, partial [Opitutaceae bacterium]